MPSFKFLNTVATNTKMCSKHLPIFLEGEVIKGFGRGSKDLGCPTANYPLQVVHELPKDFQPGVYFGWAQVNLGTVHKMVANIGWCPFYQNKEKSIETHIMHKFDEEFYGSILKISIVGYLRGEENFDSLDTLIKAIQKDIANADNKLNEPAFQQIKYHDFFTKQAKVM